ncbi:MAG: lysine exporter LysO family protein [Spirochaetaceae bacterium]|nr:lysine exporter LysO family protein [Spirochaetaceae bacterium]
MEGILQIFVLLLFMAAGAVIAKLRRAPRNAIVDSIIKIVLKFLLFGMGFRIGNNPDLHSQFRTMGLLAFATAALSIAGSCLCMLLASCFVPGMRRRAEAVSPRIGLKGFGSYIKTPVLFICIVAAGGIAGYLIPPVSFDIGQITGWTLNALLFFIGMQFYQSGTSLKGVLASPVALAVPLATFVGTLASSLLLVPLFSLTPGKAMALAGGFGWYSLSGVLITNLGDPFLGSVSFLANLFRESLAFILIPFLGKSRVPTMAVSVGGATAMDVTLPLIEQSVGPWIVPISFVSGALLSLVVPLLVPLCFRLG